MRNIKGLFGLLFALTIFTTLGCGSANPQEGKQADIESTRIGQREESSKENGQIEKSSEEITEKKLIEIQVNREEKEINYVCNEQEVSLRKCVTNGENIYLLQAADYTEKPSLYEMKIGEEKTKKLDIQMPENLEICNLTVDIDGNLHLLLNTYEDKTKEQSDWQIWVLDNEYNVVKQLDVSAAFEGKTYQPNGFYIDKLDCYYIQGRWDMVPSMVLDSQGVLCNILDSEALGIESVQSVGRGKDGKIYLVYGGDRAGTIGVLDGTAGSMEKEYEQILPENDTYFLEIEAGTDTDLLLFSATSGLWAYNMQDNNLSHRVEMEEKVVPINTVILYRRILQDGRLLIIENILEDNGDLKYRNFKYIAGGE